LHWEIGNAFSAMFKRKKITLSQAKKAIEIYSSLPIEFFSVDLSRTLEISEKQNIYAYDAYMIFLAEKFSCPLCTLDTALKSHAKEFGVFSFSL
jgi:predicted nucleic acid-binding protein